MRARTLTVCQFVWDSLVICGGHSGFDGLLEDSWCWWGGLIAHFKGTFRVFLGSIISLLRACWGKMIVEYTKNYINLEIMEYLDIKKGWKIIHFQCIKVMITLLDKNDNFNGFFPLFFKAAMTIKEPTDNWKMLNLAIRTLEIYKNWWTFCPILTCQVASIYYVITFRGEGARILLYFLTFGRYWFLII